MKKQALVITMALLGLLPVACQKKQPVADQNQENPAVSAETKLRAAYGFAARIPSNAEGYSALYNLGKFWSDIKQSKTVADISAIPSVKQLLAEPSFANAKSAAAANPDFAKWRAIISDACGTEAFLEFGPGSTEKIKTLVQMNREMQLANIEQSMNGTKAAGKQNPFPALLPFVGKAGIPPVLA